MSQDLLVALEAALTDEERAVYDDLVAQLQIPGANVRAIQSQFFAWAGPVVSRIGEKHPGKTWGMLMRKKVAKKQPPAVRPLPEIADVLPYPLGLRLRQLLLANRRRQEGESEPQFPFEVCAVMGVVVRLSALILIRAYVESGRNNAQSNDLIVTKLRAPSDGGWLEVSQRLGKSLKGRGASPLADLVQTALTSSPALDPSVKKKAGGAKTAGAALQQLIKFRNDLVHGEPITDGMLERAMALLELVVRGFAPLATHALRVRHKGKTWSLNGNVPTPVTDDPSLPEDEPCLVPADNAHAPLSLSPLLRFRAGEGAEDVDVDFDELFFLNAGSLQRLSYIGYRAAGQVDGKSLGSYEAFKQFMRKIPTPPMPVDPCLDFSGLMVSHSRLFVGRGTVLAEIAAVVHNRPGQYAVLKALAGMGKSAIFATILQEVTNRTLPESERIETPASAVVRDDDRWVFHFCMPTDGRNSPTVALRSLIAQICDAFSLPRKKWLSHDLEELKDDKFPGLLAAVSGCLEGDSRLVVVVDALDEGFGAEKDSVAACIPTGTYENVLFLLSYRVNQLGENSRVEKELVPVAQERRIQLETADPLAGLTRADVVQFLDKVSGMHGQGAVPVSVVAAVWDAASRDAREGAPAADPFYLRFVANGVQSGSIRLARSETVPESLDDAFEEMWMALPTGRDFLCHRVLLTLGIMREYGDDELFATLFNRTRAAEDRLLPDDVAAVRVKAGKLLVYDGDRYGLFHDRFRTFLVGEQPDPIAEALGTA